MHPTLVIMPTYNEVENVRHTVEAVLAAAPVDLLIVDDNSPDGTGEVADILSNQYPAVHVLHHGAKAGLGAAYLAGFAWAAERDYAKVFEMDADGSHQPRYLPAMIAALDAGTDMVVGSRWMPGSAVENWPLRREILSRGGNLYVRLLLGIGVKDATGGYRGFTRSALSRLDLTSVQSQGYCFQVDLLWRVLRAGLRVTEIPIVFREREHGYSKMSGGIIVEALWQVTRWGVRRLVRAGH